MRKCCVWTRKCCVRIRMSRKERRKKEKNLLSADGWLADVLRADALACGRGRVASGCGRVGVWTWMCCVRMRMSRKERKKKKKKLTLVRTCCVRTCWRVCCVRMRMSRKERKKKRKRKRKNLLQCGRVACRRVGVWTWMCCMRMRMSRKERKKKKKKTYFTADVLRADALACVLRADADE